MTLPFLRRRDLPPRPCHEQAFETLEGIVLKDAELILQVLLDLRELHLLDLARPQVFSTPSRVNTCTSMTVPFMPEGTRCEVSFTSDAFSPNIARSSFSSGVS